MAAKPAWLKGTKTAPSATCSVTRPAASTSPAAVVEPHVGPVGDVRSRRVGGMDLRERRIGERRLQLVGALGEPALIDEERVREQEELAVPDAGGHREGLCPQRRPRLPRRQEPAHLLVELVHGLEPEVSSAGERQTGEDLPVGTGHPERIADRVETLAAAFPGGDVPVLLEEGRGRQEHIRERLERAELERLHHLPGHVLQGTPSERRVRVVPEGVDADQEQHVDLSVGTGLEDPAPGPALGRLERPPDVLDFRPILRAPDPTSARQERRVDPGHERAAVVRAAGDVGESRARCPPPARPPPPPLGDDRRAAAPRSRAPRHPPRAARSRCSSISGRWRPSSFPGARPRRRDGTRCARRRPRGGSGGGAARRSARRRPPPSGVGDAGWEPPARRPGPRRGSPSLAPRRDTSRPSRRQRPHPRRSRLRGRAGGRGRSS